jgi:hypothetical protein
MRLSTNVEFELGRHCTDEEAEAGPPYVLNLCSVPRTLAIPQPRSPALARYAFFVSRGVEGHRDQCWLHMGYFQSCEEAQKWLQILKRVYPMAFITPAQLTFIPGNAEAEYDGAARQE